MGLPVIQEVWDGIRWIIDFFLNKAPRPVQVIFFLLLLLILGNIFNFMLHIVGIHCNTDKEVLKMDTIDIVGNFNVIWLKSNNVDFDENVTLDELHPYRDVGFGICQRQYILTDAGCYDSCDNISDPDCNYYYTGGEDCYSCNETIIKPCSETGRVFGDELFGAGSGIQYCSDDATQIEWSFFQRWLQCNRRCGIPEGYRWESDSGTYICIDQTICGVNATDRPRTKLDDELDKGGALPLYDNDMELSGDQLVFIQCDDDLDPEITLFGLPIFNYKIWVILLTIAVLFIFLNKIKRH